MDFFVTRRFSLFALTLLALGLVWIDVAALPPGTAAPERIPAPRAGFPAPDFTLATPDGLTYTLSEWRGQPVIINLWASWCAPCRAEMPALQRVSQEFQDQGLLVLGINVTRQDSASAALNFAAQHGLTFPILLDPAGRVADAYQLRALPTTFFVDSQGIIQEVVYGGPMAEALLRTRVQNLLEGAP